MAEEEPVSKICGNCDHRNLFPPNFNFLGNNPLARVKGGGTCGKGGGVVGENTLCRNPINGGFEPRKSKSNS